MVKVEKVLVVVNFVGCVLQLVNDDLYQEVFNDWVCFEYFYVEIVWYFDILRQIRIVIKFFIKDVFKEIKIGL